jgi:hypothetical protein
MGKNRNFKNFAAAVEGEQQTAQPEEQGTIILGQPMEEEIIAFDGGAMQPEGDEHSTEPGEHDTDSIVEDEKPEGETETLPVAPVLVLGIGQFVRQMMLKSTKNNTEILELVHKHFPEAKTTPACIAWYKSDLRKKGLISASAVRGARSIVEFTPEMLAELCK